MHIKFPSIEQFVNVVNSVQHWASCKQLVPGKLKFYGTVKLHGTNASIVWDGKNLSYQYRNTIASLNEKHGDPYGFMGTMQNHENKLIRLCQRVTAITGLPGRVAIFGEWCGQGIMKGVAITSLPKRWVVFAASVIEDELDNYGEPIRRWLDLQQLQELYTYILELNISELDSVLSVPVHHIEIDFNNPAASLACLEQLTADVENVCPYGARCGVNGIGEGIVWINHEHHYVFKTKGLKHKEKTGYTRVELDPVMVTSIKEFAETYVVTARLEKGIDFLRETVGRIEIKQLGDFLSWVISDIRRECATEIELIEDEYQDTNPNIAKALNKAINEVARPWFMSYIREQIGL
jgi:hypothetical protein